MTWREADHPRDREGQFTEKSDWASRVSARVESLKIEPVDDEARIRKWIDWVGDRTTRAHYIQRAMRDKLDMPDRTTLLVARNRQGRPVGAASVVDYPGRDSPHMVVVNLGALEGTGAGTQLVAAAVQLAHGSDRAVLYAEPTVNAQPFWEKIGFTEDPLEVGSYYHGLPAEQFWDWFEEHGT